MRVLLVGGGGRVGRQVTPHLAEHHELVVLDPAPPAVPGVRHVTGRVDSPDALGIMSEVEAVVHLAVMVPRGDEASDPARVTSAFAVNVGSVYASVTAARGLGVSTFVHVSTMSVYEQYGAVPVDLSCTPDSAHPYGLSKRLAEEVCRTVAEETSASPGKPFAVSSLRLAVPTADEDWPEYRQPANDVLIRPRLSDGTPVNALSAHDVAAAIEAALGYKGAYRAFAIVGDARTVINDDTAAVLGWAPRHQT